MESYHAEKSEVRPYGANIGLDSEDPGELIKVLKRGLTVAAFDTLREALQLNRAQLSRALGISQRTLARRLKSGRFNLEESERIYRVSRLLSRASEVLESEDDAALWLTTPKLHLKQATPLEYADTEVGARVVERLLGRIEHGIFS